MILSKRIIFLLFVCSNLAFSQVGIGTTSPKSSLDITTSDSANPSNMDGLLIPRVDIFPTVNPTIDQQGMLVYLTTTVGSNLPGFYYWDNSATTWTTIKGGAFEVVNGVVKPNATVNINTNDFVFGSTQLNDDGNTSHDNRFYFDKSKGAFRAGNMRSNYWDAGNVGNYSTAFGSNTKASGLYATAWGYYSEAIGENSTAWASGMANGDYSTAWGNSTTADGDYATAWGRFNGAWRDYSTAWGNLNNAEGDYSTVWGYQNSADGDYSTVWGYGVRTNAAYETAFGSYNTYVTPNSAYNWNANDRLLVIGNGTDTSNRSNALTIYKNGTMNINDAYDMPTTDGTSGQALTTDGSGNVTWVAPVIGTDDQNVSGSGLSGTDLTIGIEGGTSQVIDVSSLKDELFELSGNVVRTNGSVSNATSDFVFGSTQLDNDGNYNHTKRMFFDKSKAAFRAGSPSGGDWNSANVGDYSVALGYWPKASGFGSFAVGGLSKAEGYKTMAIGDAVRAYGDYATVMGRNNNSYSYGEFVTGLYATTYVANDISNWNASDRLFVIGNGSSLSDRSNALTIYKDGKININDAYNMPITDGVANDVLTTDGAGNTSWEALAPDTVEVEAETTTIAFEATWNHYGGTWEKVTYYKDRDRVYIDGLALKTAAIGTNDPVFTLPVGYRPALKVIVTGQQAGTALRIDILSDGKVYVRNLSGSTTKYISFGGISFRVN